MIAARRKLRSRRALAEEIKHRAAYLNETDRVLVEQVVFNRVRPRELSVLTGMTPRGIQRRVRILVRRLTDPEVLYVLREHANWPPQMADVALAVWVRRQTMRDTAGQMQMSLHGVRVLVERIRTTMGDSKFGRPKRRAECRRTIFESRVDAQPDPHADRSWNSRSSVGLGGD